MIREMTVNSTFTANDTKKDVVNYSLIRLFTLDRNMQLKPVGRGQLPSSAVRQPWSIANVSTVLGDNGGNHWTVFSAACWYYGQALYDSLKIPIGLVASTYGLHPFQTATCHLANWTPFSFPNLQSPRRLSQATEVYLMVVKEVIDAFERKNVS